MRQPAAEGLVAATEDGPQCRWTITPILAGIDVLKATLVGMWKDQSPEGAIKFLENPDIGVTNQRDKVAQLAKIGELPQAVGHAFARIKAHDKVELAAQAKDIHVGALQAAVEAAERAGVRPLRLSDARHKLVAIASRAAALGLESASQRARSGAVPCPAAPMPSPQPSACPATCRPSRTTHS